MQQTASSKNTSASSVSSNTSKTSVSSMADLMRASKAPLVAFKKGDNIKGTITKLTPSEILVDIQAKTEAVVLEKDKKILRRILSLLKTGDKVEVTVLNTESEYGYPVVSLRKFVDDLSFRNLNLLKEEKKPVKIIIEIKTGGGYLVSTENGMQGFLPNSQVSFQETGDLVGRTLDAFVLEVDRASRKIIFSQKAVQSAEDFVKLTKSLKVDQKIDAVVTSITPFGLFVSLQTDSKQVEGLIHISEISWEKVEKLDELFTVGQQLQALIIGIDKEAKRVDLSLKRLTEDPFEEIVKKYAVEQKVKGVVSKIIDSGVVVDLDPSVSSGQIAEGFIRKEKIPPTVTYKEGEEITATVSQIDKRRRRIILVPVLLEKPIGYR